jgi:hypothetical protein
MVRAGAASRLTLVRQSSLLAVPRANFLWLLAASLLVDEDDQAIRVTPAFQAGVDRLLVERPELARP